MTLVQKPGSGGGSRVSRTIAEITVTIPDGDANSDKIPLGGYGQGSFQIPSAFTGATVQPKFSNDGSNWTAVGSAINVSANGTYAIPADCFKAKYLLLTSASNEGADRAITIHLKF